MYTARTTLDDSLKKMQIQTLRDFQYEMSAFISLIYSFLKVSNAYENSRIDASLNLSFRKAEDIHSYLVDVRARAKLISFVLPMDGAGPYHVAAWNGASMVIGDRPLERPLGNNIIRSPDKDIAIPPDVTDRKCDWKFERGIRRVVKEYLKFNPQAKILYKIDPENPKRQLPYESGFEYYLASRDELQVEINGKKLCGFRRHSLVWDEVLDSSTPVEYVDELFFESE